MPSIDDEHTTEVAAEVENQLVTPISGDTSVIPRTVISSLSAVENAAFTLDNFQAI